MAARALGVRNCAQRGSFTQVEVSHVRICQPDLKGAEAGGYWYLDGKGTKKYVGRKVPRIYLHNRYRYLKARGRLHDPAPGFLVDYIDAMERELRIPRELAHVVYDLSMEVR